MAVHTHTHTHMLRIESLGVFELANRYTKTKCWFQTIRTAPPTHLSNIRPLRPPHWSGPGSVLAVSSHHCSPKVRTIRSREYGKKKKWTKKRQHTQTTAQTLKRRTKNRPNAQSIRNKGIRSCEACFTGKVCTIEGVGCAWPANRAIPLMCCLFLGIFSFFSKTFLHSAAGPFLPIALVRQQVIRRQANESMTMSCHFRLPAGIACEYLAGSQNHVIRVPVMHNRESERGDSNKVKSS